MDPIITPVAAATAIRTVSDLTGSIEEAKKRIKPFKPEVKSIRLDYLNRAVEMVQVVFVPEGLRKTFSKIELPSRGLRFSEVRGSLWDPIPDVIAREGDKIVLRTAQLPDRDEQFFLILRGDLSAEALKEWVSVASSADPLDDGGCDVYWMTAALRRPELLAELYRSVEVDNVDISIQVALQRYFMTSLPPAVSRLLRAQDDLVKAAQTRDRNLRALAEATIRHYTRTNIMAQPQIAKLVGELISQATLRDHVRTSELYQVLRVDPDERRTSLVPERFAVHAGTNLSRARKIADGKLTFAREQYKSAVAARVKKLLELRDVDSEDRDSNGQSSPRTAN